MKILMALSQLEVTGAEVYATSVGNKLSEKGHQVFYVSDTLTKTVTGKFFKLRFNKRNVPRRFWHIAYLVYLIKKHGIQLVHAHSRASGWSAYLACKITNTPMITSVHGRQPVHASRKVFHALGSKAVCVCENIKQQLIENLGVEEKILEVVRNGIDLTQYSPLPPPNNSKKVISIIGRLSGPKGELTLKLLSDVLDLDKYQVQVIGGKDVPAPFTPFTDRVKFIGYVDNVLPYLAQSDLVIGAGRVAMEAIICGRPTLAVGEAQAVGLVTKENLNHALASNFGDIGAKDLDIDFTRLDQQITNALTQMSCQTEVQQRVKTEFELDNVVSRLEFIYQSEIVYTKQTEMPILCYHRVIRDDEVKGKHGIYVTVSQLEKQFKMLKKLGYQSITFADIVEKGWQHRFDGKFFMLTLDDGYKDNYENLLPLLKKYDFKAVIYMVTGEDHNSWDAGKGEQAFPLMDQQEIKAMVDSGLVEFGGHTLSHPKLTTLTKEQKLKEIAENKAQLEAITRQSALSFAYPYGDLDDETKQIAKEAGYPIAVATDSGPLANHEDLFEIRRILVFPGTDTFGLWRKVRGNNEFRYAKKQHRPFR